VAAALSATVVSGFASAVILMVFPRVPAPRRCGVDPYGSKRVTPECRPARPDAVLRGT